MTGGELLLISRQVFGPPNTAAPRPLRNVANSYPDHPLLFSPADYKWLQVEWEHCSWTSDLRCLICTPASVLSKTQIGSIFKKLQWARCRDQSDWQLFFQPDRQQSVKIRCNATKWDWSSDGLQTESKLKGNDLYSNYSLFSISRIFHLPLYLSDTFGLQGKIGPEGSNMDQISFLQLRPLYFPSKTHRGASFVTGATPVLNINPKLYVNSMYLRRLKGNTASAGDSEMLHFSLLTKEKDPGWLHKSWTNRIDAFAALRVPYSNH